MKKMMMALAALCVAGAASAVSLSWSDYSEKINEETTLTGQTAALTDVDFSETVTVTLTYTIEAGGPTTGGRAGNIFGIAWGTNPSDPVSDSVVVRAVPANTPNTGSVVTNGTNSNNDYERNDLAAITAAGDHKIVLTLDLSGSQPSITCTVDGTSLTIGFASGEYSINDDGTLTFFKYDQTWLSNVSVDVDYTSVPEPTALALLALGVAGLALRRKAA